MKTRLRDLREDNDLTQDYCAKIAFISKKTYERYEKDERGIPLEIAKIYANYYKVSIDYLARNTEIPTEYPKKPNL